MADELTPAVEEETPSLSDQLRAARAAREETPTPPSTGETPPPASDETAPASPPWGDDFDPNRAWNTIQAQREEVRELRARETAREREQMTELERTKAELAEAQGEISSLRLGSVRNQVAAAKGLPANAIGFLDGCTTQAEMERKADELLALIGERPTPPPDFGNGARPPSGDTDDFSSMLRRAAGRPA